MGRGAARSSGMGRGAESVPARKGEKTTRRGKEARTSSPVPIRLIAQNSVHPRRPAGGSRSFQTPLPRRLPYLIATRPAIFGRLAPAPSSLHLIAPRRQLQTAMSLFCVASERGGEQNKDGVAVLGLP